MEVPSSPEGRACAGKGQEDGRYVERGVQKFRGRAVQVRVRRGTIWWERCPVVCVACAGKG
jgi:hypothetical protein